MLTTVDEAKALMDEYGSVVYKMPWSGSGKGIRICKNGLTDNDVRWLANVIEKQSAVVGERYNTVAVDFAMEFYMDDSVRFEGYSLFEVNGGCYKNSMLMSDDAIENYLKQWVTIDELRLCRDNIAAYMSQLLGDSYRGCFGVDMYVYADGNGYKLNPMVEINMRMTMGYVANAVRRKLLATDMQDVCAIRFHSRKHIVAPQRDAEKISVDEYIGGENTVGLYVAYTTNRTLKL
jgi:hypothetical protein